KRKANPRRKFRIRSYKLLSTKRDSPSPHSSPEQGGGRKWPEVARLRRGNSKTAREIGSWFRRLMQARRLPPQSKRKAPAKECLASASLNVGNQVSYFFFV